MAKILVGLVDLTNFEFHKVLVHLLLIVCFNIFTLACAAALADPPLPISGKDTTNLKQQSLTTKAHITNDGPTTLGLPTTFDVVVETSLSPEQELFFKWGTYFPYRFLPGTSSVTNFSFKIDWWESKGNKTAVVNVYKRNKLYFLGPGKHIGTYSSHVNIIDYLICTITVKQNGQSPKDGVIYLGPSAFIGNIRDPSGYFKDSEISYKWLFQDGSPEVKTTYNIVEHIYEKEGLYNVQLWVNVIKNKKSFSGICSKYVRTKAKLEGKLEVSQNLKEHHISPFKEQTFHTGVIYFMFALIDTYKVFTEARFTYNWIFGDGATLVGSSNVAKHNYIDIGNIKTNLTVTALIGNRKYTGEFHSDFLIREYLLCNITVLQNGHSPQDNVVYLGLSTFVGNINNPSGYFKSSQITYKWLFQDGSPVLKVFDNTVKHIYKREGVYDVQLGVSTVKNKKSFSGNCSQYVGARGKLDGTLKVWQNINKQQTLPSSKNNFATGIIDFLFNITDDYKVFTEATFKYNWTFGDGATFEGSSNRTRHNYTSIGDMKVKLIVTALIESRVYAGEFHTKFHVQEPIQDLSVEQRHSPKKGVPTGFNVTCKGSAPVSFCWYVKRGSCKLPSGLICSPTMIYTNCRRVIEHTFNQSGEYCVNVSVVNSVSVAHTFLSVLVPGDGHHHKSPYEFAATSTILPVVAVIVLTIAIVLVVRHNKNVSWRERRRGLEVARFDFRRSQLSLDRYSTTSGNYCQNMYSLCPLRIGCSRLCPQDDEEEEEERERQSLFTDTDYRSRDERNVKYFQYGAVEMNRIYRNKPAEEFEEEASPSKLNRNFSKSV